MCVCARVNVCDGFTCWEYTRTGVGPRNYLFETGMDPQFQTNLVMLLIIFFGGGGNEAGKNPGNGHIIKDTALFSLFYLPFFSVPFPPVSRRLSAFRL